VVLGRALREPEARQHPGVHRLRLPLLPRGGAGARGGPSFAHCRQAQGLSLRPQRAARGVGGLLASGPRILLRACWRAGCAQRGEPVGEGGGWAPQVRERLDAYVQRVEATWGVAFEEGRTPGLRFMAHLWEDLNFLWKPLAVRPAPRPPRPAERAPLHAVGGGGGGKGASGLRAAALGAPVGGLGRAASAAGAPGGRGDGPGDVRAAAGAGLPQAPHAGARAAPGGGAACCAAARGDCVRERAPGPRACCHLMRCKGGALRSLHRPLLIVGGGRAGRQGGAGARSTGRDLVWLAQSSPGRCGSAAERPARGRGSRTGCARRARARRRAAGARRARRLTARAAAPPRRPRRPARRPTRARPRRGPAPAAACRPPRRRSAAGAAPLFFLHGVGLGLVRGGRLWRAPEGRRVY